MGQLSKKEKEKWPDIELRHLIFCTETFIVFIDKGLDIDWITDDKFDENFKGDRAKLNEILNRAAKIETIPNSHQPDDLRLNFKRMIGEGIARSLEHDYLSANVMVTEAEQYITNRNIEKARYWQLLSSIFSGFTSGVLVLILWSLKAKLLPFLGATAVILLLSGFAGAIGAMLSIIFRMGNTAITSEAVRSLHFLEGFGRVLGGGISGILTACMVKASILLPVLNANKDMPISIVGLAMLAGASERLAPSLLSKLDKSLKTK